MDGALLLAEDMNGVTIKNGKVSYSERNGTGVFTINTHESQSVSRQNN
jgi:hypothetical protein